MKPTDLDDLDPVEPDDETLARVRNRSGAFRRRRMGQRVVGIAAGLLVVAVAVGIAIVRVDSGGPEVNGAPSTTTTTAPAVPLDELAGVWRPVWISGYDHSLAAQTMTFSRSGEVSGRDACNTFSTTFRAGRFEWIASTHKRCVVVSPLLGVLRETTRVELRDGTLLLFRADGREVARFVRGGVTTRIELPSHTMTAGTTMKGRFVVDNETGKVIPATGCISLFQVILTNASYRPLVPWLDCLQELDIPTGVSTYPIVVRGSENAGTAPLGPLPPGTYTAALYQEKHVVPDPPPFTVEVVAP